MCQPMIGVQSSGLQQAVHSSCFLTGVQAPQSHDCVDVGMQAGTRRQLILPVRDAVDIMIREPESKSGVRFDHHWSLFDYLLEQRLDLTRAEVCSTAGDLSEADSPGILPGLSNSLQFFRKRDCRIPRTQSNQEGE